MSASAPAATAQDLPDSWYPVCSAYQLKTDRPLAIRALDADWVVFRAENGRCAAVQRYCCHMGTDLALASICENTLQCPLHHWRFDGAGRCIDIPVSDHIPEDAKLATLRCVERFGIIFVGHGAEDLFEFPSFGEGGESAHSRPKLVPMMASYETVSLNLFDVQHLTTVHLRKLHKPAELFSDGDSHLGIRYSVCNVKARLGNIIVRWLRLSATNIRVDCWGGNLLLISIQGGRPNFIMALTPNGAGQCTLYLATVEPATYANPLATIARRIKLELAASLTRAFISEDIRTLSNAKAIAGVLLPVQDAEAIRFWQYFSGLPRSGFSTRV
ncbi:MAG: Rieske 2Fe-2S domain-containing protein [Pseudomonadota bacterium]|nr:Rieske 2Fe-2S domain-containing protein [Pseudomonadota bacterium]